MMRIFAKTKDIALLSSGVLIALISFISLKLVDNTQTDTAIFAQFNNPNILLLFGAVVLGPLAEEFSFRGLFLKRKIFKYISYFAMLTYILYTNNYYLIIFLLVLILITELTSSVSIYYIYFISALIFGFMHAELQQLASVYVWFSSLLKMGLGLVLIWIVVNFGILYSILLHCLINFSVIFLVFYSYESSIGQQFVTSTEDYDITVRSVSLFNKNGVIDTDNKTYFKATNSLPSEIIPFFCTKKVGQQILGRYDIKIVRKKESIKKYSCTEAKVIIQAIAGKQ